MSSLEVLVEEFPGDKAWSDFLAAFKPSWENAQDKELFVQEIGNEDIAVVLHAMLGCDAISWMKQPIGALDGQSAHQVLRTHSAGEMVVKSLMMRMPQ